MQHPTQTQQRRLGILKQLIRKRNRGSWQHVERYRRKMERKRQLEAQFTGQPFNQCDNVTSRA